MLIKVKNQIELPETYRTARTLSMFNLPEEMGREFTIEADIPTERDDWTLGAIVGPSGSGKSSLGRLLAAGDSTEGAGRDFRLWEPRWPKDRPIIDAIDRRGDYDNVTGALSQVGLGSVAAWVRPYSVLSTGERFRADLAKAVAEAPGDLVIDEFTSTIDRQVATIGAGAFAKSWRRTGKRCILISCHHDWLPWVQPDWVFDTEVGEVVWGEAGTRPKVQVEIEEVGWQYWESDFKKWHYLLDAGPMAFATAYVGFVDGEPVAHLGMSGKVAGKQREARACRMVVMPEWQGAGIGMRFLNTLCQRELDGEGFIGYPTTTQFHTAHPGLMMALKRDPKWRQISQVLHGENKKKTLRKVAPTLGWGGHFRGVTGWRYGGENYAKA